jgi:hypothetical protein
MGPNAEVWGGPRCCPPALQDLRKATTAYIRSSFVPTVLTVSTEAAEGICLKNHLRLADLLQ